MDGGQRCHVGSRARLYRWTLTTTTIRRRSDTRSVCGGRVGLTIRQGPVPFSTLSYSTVICRYVTSTGKLVAGLYIENDAPYRDCPPTAVSSGPCDQTGCVAGMPATNNAARSFKKPLTPLEQKLKARQWSSKKAAARAKKKSAVASLKSTCYPFQAARSWSFADLFLLVLTPTE